MAVCKTLGHALGSWRVANHTTGVVPMVRAARLLSVICSLLLSVICSLPCLWISYFCCLLFLVSTLSCDVSLYFTQPTINITLMPSSSIYWPKQASTRQWYWPRGLSQWLTATVSAGHAFSTIARLVFHSLWCLSSRRVYFRCIFELYHSVVENIKDYTWDFFFIYDSI